MLVLVVMRIRREITLDSVAKPVLMAVRVNGDGRRAMLGFVRVRVPVSQRAHWLPQSRDERGNDQQGARQRVQSHSRNLDSAGRSRYGRHVPRATFGTNFSMPRLGYVSVRPSSADR